MLRCVVFFCRFSNIFKVILHLWMSAVALFIFSVGMVVVNNYSFVALFSQTSSYTPYILFQFFLFNSCASASLLISTNKKNLYIILLLHLNVNLKLMLIDSSSNTNFYLGGLKNRHWIDFNKSLTNDLIYRKWYFIFFLQSYLLLLFPILLIAYFHFHSSHLKLMKVRNFFSYLFIYCRTYQCHRLLYTC